MERLASGCVARSEGHTPCNKRARRFSIRCTPCFPSSIFSLVPSLSSPPPPPRVHTRTRHAGVRLKGSERREIANDWIPPGGPANRLRNLGRGSKESSPPRPSFVSPFHFSPTLPSGLSLSFRRNFLPRNPAAHQKTTFFLSLLFSPIRDFSFFIRSSLPFIRFVAFPSQP